MNDESPHAKVSLNAIYDVTLDTQRRVISIEEKMQELSEDSKDHEKRIRALERKVWIAAGFAAAAGAGVSQLWQALGA